LDIQSLPFFVIYHSQNSRQPSAGTSIKATAHLDLGNSVLDIGYSSFTEMHQGPKADSNASDPLQGRHLMSNFQAEAVYIVLNQAEELDAIPLPASFSRIEIMRQIWYHLPFDTMSIL
jgi:hypothetical protein